MSEGLLPHADANELAKLIRKALNVSDYEEVRVVFPQFERTNGVHVPYFPTTAQEFADIQKAPGDVLIQLGLGQWEKGHWLYPGEWYVCIPNGMEIVDINGDIERFERGTTDDDIRCGCLAYGFVRDEDKMDGEHHG